MSKKSITCVYNNYGSRVRKHIIVSSPYSTIKDSLKFFAEKFNIGYPLFAVRIYNSVNRSRKYAVCRSRDGRGMFGELSVEG